MEKVSGSLWKWQPLESEAGSEPDHPQARSRVIPGLDDADALCQQGWDLDSNSTRLCQVRVRQVQLLDFVDGDMNRVHTRQACSLESLYTRRTAAPVLCPENQYDEASGGMLSHPGVSASAGDAVQGTGGADEQNCYRVGVVPTLTVEGWKEGVVHSSVGEGDSVNRGALPAYKWRKGPRPVGIPIVVGTPYSPGSILRILHGDCEGPADWDTIQEFKGEVSLKEGEVLVGLEGRGGLNICASGVGASAERPSDLLLNGVTFTVLDTATGSFTTVRLPSTSREKGKSLFCFKAPPGHYVAGFHGLDWCQDFPWASLGLYFKRILMNPAPSFDALPNPELLFPVQYLTDVCNFQTIRAPLAPDIVALILTKLLELHLLEASPCVTTGLPQDSDYVESERKKEQRRTSWLWPWNHAKARARRPKKSDTQ